MYIEVKDLPPSIQAALESVGYGRKDIDVQAVESCDLGSASGDGYRCFAAACRLDGSRAFEVTWGSWGGANPFTSNAVDRSDQRLALTRTIAVVKGRIGGGRPVYATLYVHADALAPLLPAPAEVSEREAKILAIFKGLKSSARPEYLKREKVASSEIDALVTRGYLSRNKAGATAVTTKGRNAAAKNYY